MKSLIGNDERAGAADGAGGKLNSGSVLERKGGKLEGRGGTEPRYHRRRAVAVFVSRYGIWISIMIAIEIL